MMANCTFREKFNIPDDLVFSKEHIDSLYRLIAKNLPADIPKELWLQNVIYRGNTIAISSWLRTSQTRDWCVGTFIIDCFTWSETPEGSNFWALLHDNYEYSPLTVKYKWGQLEYNVEITKIII
jgi:hypothetical protein